MLAENINRLDVALGIVVLELKTTDALTPNLMRLLQNVEAIFKEVRADATGGRVETGADYQRRMESLADLEKLVIDERGEYPPDLQWARRTIDHHCFGALIDRIARRSAQPIEGGK